jgi:hypothetical protein
MVKMRRFEWIGEDIKGTEVAETACLSLGTWQRWMPVRCATAPSNEDPSQIFHYRNAFRGGEQKSVPWTI